MPDTSSWFSFSTYSTIRLSCSASSFFSSSATSSIASFATYSMSLSLIFMSKNNLRNPRRRPWFIHSGQKLRPHSNQLLPPDLIRHIDDNPCSLDGDDCRNLREFRPGQFRPEFPQKFQVELGIPIRRLPEGGD